MKHLRHQCAEGCDCQLCRGDLFMCVLCGSAEGQLTKDCPGLLVHPNVRDLVSAGKLEYVGHFWIVRKKLTAEESRWVPAPFKRS